MYNIFECKISIHILHRFSDHTKYLRNYVTPLENMSISRDNSIVLKSFISVTIVLLLLLFF